MHRLRSFWVALPLFLLAGCSSGLKRPIVSAELEPDPQGVQRVVVHMHAYYFEPNRIVVRAGHPVDLALKNHTKFMPHNFTIADPSLKLNEGAWLGTDHLKFTPTTPGSYTFFCHVDHHANKGMTGTLVVLP
jgi:plastocyanin